MRSGIKDGPGGRPGNRRLRLASALLATLLPWTAFAEDMAADRAQLRQDLEEARAELERAGRRIAELSRQLGEPSGAHVMSFGRKRPMLGLVLGADPEKGVRLDAVTPNGPAERAGLRVGDIVTGIDGQPLLAGQDAARVDHARRALRGLEEGQKVRIDYERDGVAAQIEVTAESLAPMAFLRDALPSGRDWNALLGVGIDDIDVERIRGSIEQGLAQAQWGLGEAGRSLRVVGATLEDGLRFSAWHWQGLRLAPLNDDLGRYFGSLQGVLVLAAEGAHLEVLRGGDVIQSVDDEAVSEPREVMRRLGRAEPGRDVRLSVLRDRRTIELALKAPGTARTAE